MKNRILSFLLCTCTLITSVGIYLPVGAIDLTGLFSYAKTDVAAPSVEITLDGVRVDEMAIGEFEKKTVNASVKGGTPESYRWQILVPESDDLWVDIHDKIYAECEISTALIDGMLNVDFVAYLRCRVSLGEGISYYSSPLKITLTEANERLPKSPQCRPLRTSEMLSESEGNDSYVTITIKYLRIDGGDVLEVYKPYVANILSGSAFSQTVISPTLLGYAPYYDSDGDGDLESADSITFDLSAVSESIEITVFYQPIEVNYSVRYFFQNIGDDLYTENAGLFSVKSALTGTVVTEEMLRLSDANTSYTVGFTKMYHIPDEVAADGSTVFECYYDRLYYLLIFDNNGGYGTDPIYARYGTPFVVNDPIRYGYVFLGWDADGNGIINENDALPTTIQANNDADGTPVTLTYTALWERADTNYTIAYWSEETDGYRYFIGNHIASAKSGALVSGKDDLYLTSTYICGNLEHTHDDSCNFRDRYLEFVRADQNVTVKGDGSTVVNVYYKHKDYTLRFYYARSRVVNDATVYQVVGGSTYNFGASAGSSDKSVSTLLGNVQSNQWGKVKELPKIKDEYINDPELISTYNLQCGSTDSTFNSTYTYYYLEFTASFDSNISAVWPVDIFESVEVDEKHAAHGGTNTDYCPYQYAYFSAWNGQYGVKYSHDNTNQTIKGMYQYLDESLIFDAKRFPTMADNTEVSYLCFWENGANIGWSIPKIFEYNIYLENPDSTYSLFRQFNVYDNSNVNQQTKANIEGYKFNHHTYTDGTDEATGLEKHVISYYYDLDTENYLHFYNYNSTEKSILGIQYGTGLSSWLNTNGYGDYIALPPYPDELEQNAYSFGGWYTTSDCFDGTEADLTTITMPANDLTLYAKWVPVSHNVNFFVTLDQLRDYENGGSVTPFYSRTDITHGNVVGSVNNPINGELIFKGWFYIDETEGGKRAFVPTAMPINKDLNIYAEWDSRTAVPFRIKYVLLDDPTVSVADDTTGYAYASTTRTFQAKAGAPLDQLYAAYRDGYYPTVSSHSITMQMDAEDNIYTFYYTYADKLTYTVNYINRETNVIMATETLETERSMVTVSYRHYENMIPDAFYKQLVLSINADDNVINFYYTPNKVKVYYAVHYMLARSDATATELSNYSIDGSGGYEDSGTYLTGIEDKGSDITVSAESFTGFTVTTVAKVASNGTVKNATTADGGATFSFTNLQDGDEVYIFYTRNSYDYKVHYYRYNTTESIIPSTGGTALWGTGISLTAPAIDGYRCVNLEPDGKRHLTVKEGGNILIFYYAPVQRVIEYVAVVGGEVLDGAGRLSNSREIVSGSEVITGSVAHTDAFYRFDGWFYDEQCTVPLINGTHGTLTDANGDGIAESFVPYGTVLGETDTNTFYAKFTPLTGDITVILGGSEVGQISVIEVKNLLTGEVIYATVSGNGTVVIKNVHLNNYTVSINGSWSWRYDDLAVSCTHSNASGTTVQLTLNKANGQWISGSSAVARNES